MINNHMGSEKSDEAVTELKDQPSRPNESTGIYVRGFVKISDPENGQVFVETAN